MHWATPTLHDRNYFPSQTPSIIFSSSFVTLHFVPCNKKKKKTAGRLRAFLSYHHTLQFIFHITLVHRALHVQYKNKDIRLSVSLGVNECMCMFSITWTRWMHICFQRVAKPRSSALRRRTKMTAMLLTRWKRTFIICNIIHTTMWSFKLFHSCVSLRLSQMDGPFQDIEMLKLRPAHMTVFMRYVFTQLLDPNPLVSLYYMFIMDLYKTWLLIKINVKTKEADMEVALQSLVLVLSAVCHYHVMTCCL